MSFKIERKESDLEKSFRIACRRYGGVAKKQKGFAGDLDRRVVWPNGVTTYAELKRPDGTGEVSELQEKEIKELNDMGHLAMVVASEVDIAVFIQRSLERVLKP